MTNNLFFRNDNHRLAEWRLISCHNAAGKRGKKSLAGPVHDAVQVLNVLKGCTCCEEVRLRN